MAWNCQESGDVTASFLRIISTFPTQKKTWLTQFPKILQVKNSHQTPLSFGCSDISCRNSAVFLGGARNHSLIPILSPQSSQSSITELLATSDFDSPQKRHTTTEDKAQRAGDSTETLVMDHVSDHRLRPRKLRVTKRGGRCSEVAGGVTIASG